MLNKQSVNINFAQGLDTKTDPWQVPAGKFLKLENSIFLKGGLLQKRNGYAELPTLPSAANYLTTFKGDLTAIGSYLYALAPGYGSWVQRGDIEPMDLSTLSLIRNNLNQSQSDAAVSTNGLICTAYTEVNAGVNAIKYAVADSLTGQNVIAPTVISSASLTYGQPRVFLLGAFFIIVFVNNANNLAFIAVSTLNPSNVTGPTVITTSHAPSPTKAFDGAVLNSQLYLAWNGAAASGIKMAYINNTLAVTSTVIRDAAHVATLVSVSADAQNQHVWVSYYDSVSTNGYNLAVDPQLNTVRAATQIITAETVKNISATAQSGINLTFYEVGNNYSYTTPTSDFPPPSAGASIPSNYIKSVRCNDAGVVSAASTVVRSVGLASKSFYLNGTAYFLAAYQSPYQPTYFLIDQSGVIVAKLAYQNGGGYLTTGLPGVSISGQTVQIPYLIKDLIQAVNKNTNVPSGSQVAGIYSQTGINLATFTFQGSVISAEIGSNLNLTGGFTYGYDGYSLTEQGFHLYPDAVKATWSAVGGNIEAQQNNTNTNAYYYVVTYEWSDNQGNAFRSAPSIPLAVTTTGAGNTGSIELKIPTLRLTSKTANAVKICIYRWGQGLQSYYQVTSITSPLLNNPAVDSVTFTDTLANSSILGNALLYTTGGVVENIGPPAFSNVFLFDNRLWGISSEDRNLLWFSKQVIEATPVEMSDLLTKYIAPSTGAQGPSGDLVCGFPMDDKAILFKKAAIAYFNGSGPDNTGANNQYSEPFLITSTIGCSNPASIVFTPNGLMFEFASEAGNQIWLLGRGLQTEYIGAAVESLTQNATVLSAVNIPGTNQVRFTLSSGVTLMYDYYYQQWGTFTGVPAVSSCLYQGVQAFVNNQGEAYQETPGLYLDGASPVLMSFKTSWINLMGIQGYQRAFFFYLLGRYITPHKLFCEIAYDFNDSPSQGSLITPTNFSPNYGSPAANGQITNYGVESPFGGPGNVEQWRVFLSQQRCSAFQVSITEVYDPSYGIQAGAGLTLSGLNLVVAAKKTFRTMPAVNSIGG